MDIENYTDEELIEIAKKKLAKEAETKKRWAIYNKRIKWANERYKEFALENGFTLPELPEELK